MRYCGKIYHVVKDLVRFVRILYNIFNVILLSICINVINTHTHICYVHIYVCVCMCVYIQCLILIAHLEYYVNNIL